MPSSSVPVVRHTYKDCGSQSDDKPSRYAPYNQTSRINQKKKIGETPLERSMSRELRGGILYTGCNCMKRNGMQQDCRRTGCQGKSACMAQPYPVCALSRASRLKEIAESSAAGDGGSSGSSSVLDAGDVRKRREWEGVNGSGNEKTSPAWFVSEREGKQVRQR